MPNTDNIPERVKTLIIEYLGAEPSAVTDDAEFEDLDCDSLDKVDLIMEAEDLFGVDIPDNEVEQITTVGDAIKLIEDKLKEQTT